MPLCHVTQLPAVFHVECVSLGSHGQPVHSGALNRYLRAQSSHCAGDGPPKASQTDARPETRPRRSTRARRDNSREVVMMQEAILQSCASSRDPPAMNRSEVSSPAAAAPARSRSRIWRSGDLRPQLHDPVATQSEHSENREPEEITPELLQWSQEACAMWLEEPNEDEKILILFHMLDVIGYPSDVSDIDSSASALSTELDSDSDVD